MGSTADKAGALYSNIAIKHLGGGIHILSTIFYLEEGVSVIDNYAANAGGVHSKSGTLFMIDHIYR